MTLRSLTTAAILGIAIAATAQYRLYADEFDLADVTITDSTFCHARDLNVSTLLSYDTDRLLAPFLKEAGLTPRAESFANWDGLDGHVGGHYLSALAIHYAATGDSRLLQRLEYMLSELKRCQDANGDGYVGGVPGSRELWGKMAHGDISSVFDRWVPWYNIHKTFAGLRDAWLYAGDERARSIFIDLCDWCLRTISAVSDTEMERMLGIEFGGMNEVLADAYAITCDARYLDAARRFSHHWLLDAMSTDTDNLDNRHANTQVPKAIGYQRVAELSGDTTQLHAARFFWHTVADTRSLAFGGNSRREHFAPTSDCGSYVTDREGPETCNTYNMLKLTEGLFRIDPHAHYADFYERALYNHILSSQHPDHGGYVYFTSARPGHYRVYSTPNSAMWCCVGSGMENHGKYGQFVYTRHDNDSTLRVNLYVSSILDWHEKGIIVTQQSQMPLEGHASMTITAKKPQNLRIMLRCPSWTHDMAVKVNGRPINAIADTSGYIAIERKWQNGDRIDIEMPMDVRLEPLPHMPQYVAIMRGPIVLAAKYTTDKADSYLADDGRWAHIAGGDLINVLDTPILTGVNSTAIERALQSMRPVDGLPGHYTIDAMLHGNPTSVEIQPFASIHDSRYIIYWLTASPEELEALEHERTARQAVIDLDRRTVDAVNTGEQQPEADHRMHQQLTTTGAHNGEPWRQANAGGHFAYIMATDSLDNLSLMVRYCSDEMCTAGHGRVMVEGVELTTNDDDVEIVDKSGFYNITYAIPPRLLQDKKHVEVRFCPNGTTPTRVYHARLVKP